MTLWPAPLEKIPAQLLSRPVEYSHGLNPRDGLSKLAWNEMATSFRNRVTDVADPPAISPRALQTDQADTYEVALGKMKTVARTTRRFFYPCQSWISECQKLK